MLDPGELYIKHPCGGIRAIGWLCSGSVHATIYSNLVARKISTETEITNIAIIAKCLFSLGIPAWVVEET